MLTPGTVRAHPLPGSRDAAGLGGGAHGNWGRGFQSGGEAREIGGRSIPPVDEQWRLPEAEP